MSAQNEAFMNSLDKKRESYLQHPNTQEYRKALQEVRFHPLQFSLIQKRPKLLWDLRNSLPVFFWLVSHINRDDGSNDRTVWAELDRLYKEGYLVTVRHIEHVAKELGCNPQTVSQAVKTLKTHGFMQVEQNYTWGSKRTGWYHANLYIFGYREEEGEIWFYHSPIG